MASSETDPFSSSNPTASSENNSFSTFPLPSSEHDAYSNSAASSDDLRSASPFCMHKFRLYETRSKFYMVGRNKNRTYWRVLKIDRMDLSELNIREDSAVYTETECSDLLRRIHEGNKSTGGLKFVSTCYGIVGFIKFLGPYYMLLITKRCQIGTICGHPIYGVSRSEMIPLSNAAVLSRIAISKTENRYKKLLCSVDLTKDFFFSYSYQVMRSLQKNICDNETGHALYETMFVWNEFLTRGIRNHLHNTIWTVALVYGFFKQGTVSLDGRDFKLTLIARRSRHYAGTRNPVVEESERGKETKTAPLVNITSDYEISSGNNAANSSQSLQKRNGLLKRSLSAVVAQFSPEVGTSNRFCHIKGKRKRKLPKHALSRLQIRFRNGNYISCPHFLKKIRISWKFAAPKLKHLFVLTGSRCHSAGTVKKKANVEIGFPFSVSSKESTGLKSPYDHKADAKVEGVDLNILFEAH
ncbi:phosphoinositide phosphatase SAC3 [Cucumis melo var. makuwa]|uniref:Phosphoinositide phosphatase SAC3 n=1 Tax=Cucumis melo var. makuwa TaxID=1194695 RepID=A0A5D3CST9_CUCMM|nr:phosphoinositide phosphatase SAC3 [Cucumis melo var. makuwa]